MGKAEKINVTLPSRLIHLIDSKVAHDSRYKSRSGFLAAGAELLLRG
jgi:Arc/MetJ-type ribon-helix-helix transcriptional regulator